MTTLRLERVEKVRGRGARATAAIRGVSLSVAAGEVVILEGPSGSGKTTLLALAAGLLRADGGTVELDGRLLVSLDAPALLALRAARVGFVFQRANLLPGLDVRSNVLLQAALAGMESGEAANRADGLLEELGLTKRALHRPGELSAGEEQRAAVARALVHGPALVLADEPTASLDAAAGEAVAAALARAGSRHGAAVVVATHDPRLATYGSRRVRLLDGIVVDGEG